MTEPTSPWPRRRVATNGIELDVTEAGRRGDPVVVLAHGFPETAFSWRHQLDPIAAGGYHVLAPDQRGYGGSSAPDGVGAYRVDQLSADLAGLLDDVGVDDALFVGHDWGALVVWDMARLLPDRVRGVVNVSVPYTPWPMPPTELFRQLYGDRFFYMTYFQPVGPAETELDAAVEIFLRTLLWVGSADGHEPPTAHDQLPPLAGTGFVDALRHGREIPDGLPPWIGEDELRVYVDQFTASGFAGPLNWYRNLDANHALTEALAPPGMPCAFIGGEQDGVIAHRRHYVDAMEQLLPDYRGTCWIDRAGHWTQQERPDRFNDALLDQLDHVR